MRLVTIPSLSAFCLMLLACLGGCARKESPYLGRWTGGFTVQSVASTAVIRSPAKNSLKGFIQLYLTDDRCTMHLDGEQEGVELKGHWELRPHQLMVRFNDSILVDDAGGAFERDPNKAFISAADIRKALSSSIGLNISKNRKLLQSPTLLIGPLTGHFEFSKDTPGH